MKFCDVLNNNLPLLQYNSQECQLNDIININVNEKNNDNIIEILSKNRGLCVRLFQCLKYISHNYNHNNNDQLFVEEWFIWINIATKVYEKISRIEQQHTYRIILNDTSSTNLMDVFSYCKMRKYKDIQLLNNTSSCVNHLLTFSLNRFSKVAPDIIVSQVKLSLLYSPIQTLIECLKRLSKNPNFTNYDLMTNIIIAADVNKKVSKDIRLWHIWYMCHMKGELIKLNVFFKAFQIVLTDQQLNMNNIKALENIMMYWLPKWTCNDMKNWKIILDDHFNCVCYYCSMCRDNIIPNKVQSIQYKNYNCQCTLDTLKYVLLVNPIQIIDELIIPRLRVDINSYHQTFAIVILDHILSNYFTNLTNKHNCSMNLFDILKFEILIIDTALLLSNQSIDIDIKNRHKLWKILFSLIKIVDVVSDTKSLNSSIINRLKILKFRLCQHDISWPIKLSILPILNQDDLPTINLSDICEEVSNILNTTDQIMIHCLQFILHWSALKDTNTEEIINWFSSISNNSNCIQYKLPSSLSLNIEKIPFLVLHSINVSNLGQLNRSINVNMTTVEVQLVRNIITDCFNNINKYEILLMSALINVIPFTSLEQIERICFNLLPNIITQHLSFSLMKNCCPHCDVMPNDIIRIAFLLSQVIVIILIEHKYTKTTEKNAVINIAHILNCIHKEDEKFLALIFALVAWIIHCVQSKSSYINSDSLEPLKAMATQALQTYRSKPYIPQMICESCLNIHIKQIQQ